MSSADVTRKALTLDFINRDTVTKWAPKSYSESTIKGSFDPETFRVLAANGVGLPFYASPFFTGNYVRRGDRIKNVAGTEFELSSVREVWRLNQFVGYICQADRLLKPADRAATSGTWHTDADSYNTDARQRTITWLNTYLSGIVGDYETVFSGLDYPVERELIDNGLEVLVCVAYEGSIPEYDKDYVPYKFTETVTLTCYAIDTATLTATNLLETFEESVRKVATDHPTTATVGTVREITATKPAITDIGGMLLWYNTITINYIRPNSDYTPTYPTLTWGPSASPTGTFTFPNVIDISVPTKVNNIRMLPAGRMGSILQKLGMPDYQITIRCDLDTAPSNLTWKRPQTTTTKTDVVPWQIFWDAQFNGQIDQYYQTLNLGWGGTLQVTLEEITPKQNANGHMLELVFYVYNAASASAYTSWFGLS